MCRKHSARAFREHSVIQLSRNGAERDTAAWKINVRGIAHAHRWHRARTYGGVVFFFFPPDAQRTYGARDRDTNLFVRSQLVARPFIFHVARAIDHCSLRPVISGN